MNDSTQFFNQVSPETTPAPKPPRKSRLKTFSWPTEAKPALIAATLIAVVAGYLWFNPLSNVREDKWMQVMALTDEAIDNTEVIQSCQATIAEKTNRNFEIDSEKASLKEEVFDFTPGTL